MEQNSAKLRDLVGAAREVATSVLARDAEVEDAQALWPAASMRALGDAGLLGLQVPEALGGQGQGFTGLIAVAEVLARESASTAMCFAMHCVGTAAIAAKATDYQKQAYLEPIARGDHVTTLALSEPGTGSHFYLPQTALSHEDGEFVVRGTKSFVTNGGHADSYVISVEAVQEGTEGTFSCLVLDADTDGLRWMDAWHGLGMRGNSSRSLEMDGVKVPRRNLLGEEGDQLWYVFEVVAPYFLMAMAGTYLGVATEAFEIAREHLRTRRYAHSGELLGSSPVLAHRLGELWVELERTKQLVHSAAVRGDGGDPEALVAILGCKAAAGETSVRITNEAMTLCGGQAYAANSKLARLLRDARASHVMAPTTDILKTWVGNALLGLPLL